MYRACLGGIDATALLQEIAGGMIPADLTPVRSCSSKS